MRFGLIPLLAALCILPKAFAQENLSFGTFVGFVSSQTTGKDQLIKLELIPGRADSGDIRLRAVLTLQFGGFDSGEYVSYHFHDVQYNLITGNLNFNQTDQEVYLSSAQIRAGSLTGNLSSSSGSIGPVSLSTTNRPLPTNPLVEPLGGEYRGTCGRTPSSLQLYTYRSTKDTYRPGNAFKAYEVKGQVGQYNPNYCSMTRDDRCVYSKITAASYNFHSGQLILNGLPFSYSCLIRGQTIDCGECSFKRSSSEMRNPRLVPNKYPIDPIDPIIERLKADRSTSIAGTYSGYVFHENLNVFQRVQIDLSTFQRTTDRGPALFIAAVARIYFGEKPGEVISYRYDAIEFPSPLLKPRFTLAQPDADVDAMLNVLDIRDGIVKGRWFSLIFGRVGSFVATKNGDLPSLTSDKIFGSTGATYDEFANKLGYIVDTVVGQDTAPVGSDNPFYPLTLYGNVWNKSGSVQKEAITSGSYDFYTGHITFIYGDQRAVSGKLVPKQPAYFRRLGGKFGTLMQNFEAVRYNKNTN